MSLTRRKFLASVSSGLAVSSLARSAGVSRRGRVAGPPNFVFILADDLGWSELGCYGNRFNETPNLDSLARKGLRFTQAYAAAPVCSPYRASLMTGMWPVRTGITDYLRPDSRKHLSVEYTTIAEALKRKGYATGLVGKWHLTGYANHGAPEVPPTAHGFDEVMVSENRGIGGGSYFYPYHFNREIKKRLPGREFLVDRCNLEAVEFIERHRGEPFFLYLSHYAVHTALRGKPNLVRKYRSKPGAGKGPRAKRNNPHLAAQLESIDRGVGMIVEKLRSLGLLERTVIFFTSDNGGELNVTSNAPLRGGKSQLYEGGIRVPLLVWAPGLIKKRAVCETPVATVDFFPTFLDLAGVKPRTGEGPDGVSLVPLFKDPAAHLKRKRDALFWHYPLRRPHFLGGRSSVAVRKGRWKLIEFFDTGKVELYDLKNDIGEKRNLASRRPRLRDELKTLLRSWRREFTH